MGVDVTYAYAADITKAERDEAGDLVVYGKATGPDLDLDEQICDPTWLKSAMPEWFEFGNVREMHSPIAAGVGIELTNEGDDWYVKSKCIDPNTAKKIEAGVLKGYSVGIKAPKVVKDADAPGGRITGGTIVELSYVDRPCNPTAKMAIAKAAGVDNALVPVEADPDDESSGVTIKVAGAEFTPGDLAKLLAKKAKPDNAPDEQPDEPSGEDTDETGVGEATQDDSPKSVTAEAPVGDEAAVKPKKAKKAKTKASNADVEKRQFTQEQRDDAAESGDALPDGSFPIKTVGDLKNAIRAVGRAKDPAKAKAHIRRRAKDLGRPELAANLKDATADTTKAGDGEQTHDPADVAAVRDGLVALIKAELDELCEGERELHDVGELLCALQMLMCWWEGEAAQGETDAPYTDPSYAALAADADTTKVAPEAAPQTSDPNSGSVEHDRLAELVKSAVADAVKSVTKKAAKERKALEAELKQVKTDLAKTLALPEPGGPVLTRTALQGAVARDHDANQLRTQAQDLLDKADKALDPYLKKGYQDRAAELLARADA